MPPPGWRLSRATAAFLLPLSRRPASAYVSAKHGLPAGRHRLPISTLTLVAAQPRYWSPTDYRHHHRASLYYQGFCLLHALMTFDFLLQPSSATDIFFLPQAAFRTHPATYISEAHIYWISRARKNRIFQALGAFSPANFRTRS